MVFFTQGLCVSPLSEQTEGLWGNRHFGYIIMAVSSKLSLFFFHIELIFFQIQKMKIWNETCHPI